MRIRLLLWIFLLVFVLPHSVWAQAWSGALSSSRGTDWSNYAGIPTYSKLGTLPSDTWTQCGATIAPYGSSGAYASPSPIISAISGCTGTNKYVLLGSGNFYIHGAINNNGVNNVELRGSGPTATHIFFNADGTCVGGAGQCAVGFQSSDTTYGGGGQPEIAWTSGYSKGATSITLASGSGIVAGKTWIVLNQCDTGYSGVACSGSNIDNGAWFNGNDPYVQTAHASGTCTVSGSSITGTGFSSGFGSTILLTISGTKWAVPFTFGSSTSGTIGQYVQTSGSASTLTTVGNGSYACSFPSGVSFNSDNGAFAPHKRWQWEMAQAVSCSPTCGSSSGATTVTIDTPLIHSNWNSSQTPEAFLIQPSQNVGVRNLTIDCSACSFSNNDRHAIAFNNIDRGWVRNVVTANSPATCYYMWQVDHLDISSNYCYNPGTQTVSNDPSGLNYTMFNTVFANNIIHNAHVAILGNGPSAGNVIAYNLGINTYTGDGFLFGGMWDGHSNGSDYALWEGNIDPQFLQDQTHGSHLGDTLFRNFFYGWESCANGNCGSNTAKTNSVMAIENLGFNRYLNTLYNVLGTPNISTAGYSVTQPDWNTSGTTGRIYNVGSGNGSTGTISGVPLPADPYVFLTDYKWGNWDAFHGSTQYNSAEVPTSISFMPQTVPTSVCTNSTSCPASFFYTGRPGWWASSIPYPVIGSDVTSGNIGQCAGTLNAPGKFAGLPGTTASQCGSGNVLNSAWGGHVNANPAMSCYLSLGGNLDGTSTQLRSFDANTCYLAGGGGATSTSTALAASTTTPVAGSNVTLTATITPSSGPTGIVTFSESGSAMGTGTVSAGHATFLVTSITTGAHSYTATYGGDSTYLTSTSSSVTVTASGGTTYTVTAPHYTMHQGDLVPPCIIQISGSSGIVSESSTLFSGAASCSIGATSSSAVGTYTVTVSAGSLTPLAGGATISTANSSISVIASDGKGAALSTVSYPTNFLSGVRFPAINVASNAIANWVGDGTTDNADAILELLAFGRGTQLATVGVATSSGTSTITWTSGTQFTGLASGSPIIVDGLINTIASVTDATHLVTGSTVEGGATLTSVQLEFPPWVVNTSGTTVTAVSGPTFVGETGNIIIGQTTYTISSVTDATHLVLATSAGTQSSKKMYEDAASCCSSGSGGSVPQNFYIPSGVYATSQPVHLYLNYWQLMGVGPQSSVIKLLPNSAAFNTGTATEFVNPQSLGGNQNFHQYLFNIGIEIGRGNPNAVPLTSEMNNVAAIRNMQIWADDSVCPYAFGERRGFPGPMLLKNVAMYGCTNAISSNQHEYLTTLEGLTVEGQLGLVVDPTSHNYAFRHVLSDNTGQFLRTGASAPFGVIALLDSELLNGNGSTTAITVASGGSVYVKNTNVTGYLHSIVDSSTGTGVTVNGNVTQSWSGSGQSLFGGTPDSLHLTENETPIPSDPSPSTWTALSTTVANWPTEISGSSSTTVYTPPGGYNTTAGTVTINVPDTVNHILFYQAKRSNATTYTLNFNVAGISATPIVIDGCIYQACNINHTGSRTVVLLDSVLNQYTAASGAGDLYIEDSILAGTFSATVPTFYSSQHVWARHLNLEAHNIDKFHCDGCTLWALGYKTEEPFPNIVLTNNAHAEIFGSFMYSNVAPSQPSQILLTDSAIFIVSVIDTVDVAGRGNTDWVTETQSGVTRNLATGNINSSINLPMYYSTGGIVITPPPPPVAGVSNMSAGTKLTAGATVTAH